MILVAPSNPPSCSVGDADGENDGDGAGVGNGANRVGADVARAIKSAWLNVAAASAVVVAGAVADAV